MEGKTIKKWLETLPEEYKTKALENTSVAKLEIIEKTLSRALLSAFSWANTNEGLDFWITLFDQVREGKFGIMADFTAKIIRPYTTAEISFAETDEERSKNHFCWSAGGWGSKESHYPKPVKETDETTIYEFAVHNVNDGYVVELQTTDEILACRIKMAIDNDELFFVTLK